ncbi:MAG: DUF1405 domain-containing protein [Candidatus Nanohaloarchaea archaeon]
MDLQVFPETVREKVLDRKPVLAIALANVLGALFGFYYYLPQFRETAPALWLFVPDSPFATLLMAFSLLYFLRGRGSLFLEPLAFIANFKYGLWTVFVLLFYFETFFAGNSTAMYLFLLLSHLLMALQAFLVLDYGGFEMKGLLAAAGVVLVNDAADYVLDTHTWIHAQHTHPVSPAMAAAFSLTLLAAAIYCLHRGS